MTKILISAVFLNQLQTANRWLGIRVYYKTALNAEVGPATVQ